MRWDEVTRAIMAELANAHLSGSDIANHFGVTRSAVLGKANRMGIKLKSRPFDQTGIRKRDPDRRATPKKRGPKPPPTPLKPSIPFADGKSLLDLRADECRFPSGDGPYIFCAAPTHMEASYCLAHCRVAYREA